MKQKNKNTAPSMPAVNAALALFGKWKGTGEDAEWTVDAAAVVDKKTHLPQLLHSLEMTMRQLEDLLRDDRTCLSMRQRVAVEAVVGKAKKDLAFAKSADISSLFPGGR